ncbi:hypothetical protein MKJ01_00110 [Chryseobacterium sp. SSA4.19]|uniref:hypothetical protein n=1 Tax=Chryseobacterium sp. SSA4.19 TaxID=2919915 RepID=UPI001F4DA2E7|nr:hypothetical protein [Chryseobacterium sp. SSA4.19]MCJ8152162.1 hypothetical protein [Chryseobacterium sp. SSA4.19]
MENIQIPNPCSEKWETMSPQEKGRFCSVCSKCVIDFTQKQQHEIQQIFIEKKNEKICGRFYHHQLHNSGTSDQLKIRFFDYIPQNFQNNRILLTLFSLILFLIGCSKEKKACTANTEKATKGTEVKVADTEQDNLKNQDFIMGEIPILEDDSITKIHKSDSTALKKKSSKK